MREPRVLVLGATGQMGQRLMRLLHELLPQGSLFGASRSPRTAHNHLALNINEPPAPGLIQRGDVLIDAVGPYRHDPAPWLLRCAQVGAHWIDLSEAQRTHTQVQQLRARFTQSGALTGCSTMPAMAALLLKPVIKRSPRPVLSAQIFLSMGSDNPASAGLIYSLLRPLGRPLPSTPTLDAWQERATRRLTSGHKRVYGSYPCPALDLGVPTRFWSGFDRGLLWYPLRGAAMLTPHLSDKTLMRVSRLAAYVARLVRPLGTKRGSLRLECLDERGALIGGLEIHAHNEGLDIPALPAVWASLALLGTSRVVSRLDELIGAEEVKADLTRRGYEHVVLEPRDEA